ncbi:desmin [Austrofundulus limnaeus]|uniref:Desmin n=1 Tax=Austrofundulus limnaeus TaxID=52670 RepID=A0A2I4CVX5_AUSLI|nr:PREDICTED: desmin-like [Austrofundulus limnaeus]
MSDFDALGPVSEEFLKKRNDEKAQLQLLNTRFASYIEKISSLKLQNKELTLEVESLRSYSSTSITEMQTEETSKLVNENKDLLSDITSLKVEQDKLKKRLDEEIRSKKDAEKLCEELRVELEAEKQKLKSETEELQKKIKFQQKLHDKEVVELKRTVQMKVTKGSDQVDNSKSELAVVLDKIRKQYEDIAKGNITKAEELYKHQIEEQRRTANKNRDELTKAQQEITELKSQIQNFTSEISSLQSTIKTMEDNHKHEKDSLDSKINQMKGDMANQLCKYQNLLCVKMELDMEISCYRTLLDEEERRIGILKPDNNTSSNTDSSQGKEPPEKTTVSSSDQDLKVETRETTVNESIVSTSINQVKELTSSNPDVSQKQEQSGMTSPPVTEKTQETENQKG